MNRDQVLGIVRELLMAVGAYMVAYGFTNDVIWQQVIGTGTTAVMLYFAIRSNEGVDILKSLLRKVLSSAGGVAVGLGWVTPEKAESLTGLITTLIAVVWSFTAKGGQVPPAAPLVAFLALLCSSCGVDGMRFTKEGCLLGKFARAGQTFWSGPCVDEQGKVDRLVLQWENDTGYLLQATLYDKTRKVDLEYQIGGAWVKWSKDSGIRLGRVPAEVAEPLKEQGVPVEEVLPVEKAEVVKVTQPTAAHGGELPGAKVPVFRWVARPR